LPRSFPRGAPFRGLGAFFPDNSRINSRQIEIKTGSIEGQFIRIHAACERQAAKTPQDRSRVPSPPRAISLSLSLLTLIAYFASVPDYRASRSPLLSRYGIPIPYRSVFPPCSRPCTLAYGIYYFDNSYAGSFIAVLEQRASFIAAKTKEYVRMNVAAPIRDLHPEQGAFSTMVI